MSEKSMKFEASMERLEAIVRQLEQGNAPLDESLKLFQEGTKLVQSCAKQLDSAEQEIVKLTKPPTARRQKRSMYEMSEFHDQIARYRAAIEALSQAQFCQELPQKRLFDAMRYSLLAGGNASVRS